MKLLEGEVGVIEFVVTHSEDPDTRAALDDLLAQARERAGGRPVRAGVLLAGIDHDHATALAAIMDAFPGLALIGCTTDGEISSAAGYCEDSLLLLLFVGDGFSAAAGLGRDADRDAAAAADAGLAAARAGLSEAPRLCLTTPESLTCDAVVLGDRLRAGLGADVPIIGGTAADSWRFKRCLQFCGREVVNSGVPVLLLAGDFKLACGVACGWNPIGNASVATEVQGNILARIGERTALDFYQHMLGPHRVPSGEYPLAVFVEGDDYYLRAPVGYDAERGTIVFAGSIPPGARVQITTATRDGIVAATGSAVETALAAYPGIRPVGAFVVSCAARKQLLGTRTAEEQALLRRSAPAGLPFAGFYAYGELSPKRAGEPTLFHNETFVTVILGAE